MTNKGGWIIDKLVQTNGIVIASEEELVAFEQNNPHPDEKRWSDTEQAIGNFYWGAHFITCDMSLLLKFGRLDFTLPVSI